MTRPPQPESKHADGRVATLRARRARHERPKLTEQAEADLDDLWTYIAANNVDAADRVVDAVLESSRMHVRFPNMGERRDELQQGLRCFVVSPYVIYYRAVEETIEVLRILHGARDVTGVFEREDTT